MSEVDLAGTRGRTGSADAALVLGLRQRRPEASAQLYDRFAPSLHRFALTRLGGDIGVAEDLVVETLADACRSITTFKPRRSSLSAWLFGIARRRVQMEIRRQRRRKTLPAAARVPMEAALETAAEGDLAADAGSRLDAQQKVAHLRAHLSDLEMEVLVFSCVEQLSAGEIGQLIGRSERAVHSILHRARTKARERLVGDDG